MKKTVLFLLMVVIILTFAGCGRDSQTDYPENFVQMETLSEWPRNTFTADIPELEVGTDSVISQEKSNEENKSSHFISITNVTKEQYLAYIETLKAAGYQFDRNYHIDESYNNPYYTHVRGYYTVNNIFEKRYESHPVPTIILGKGTTSLVLSYSEANKYIGSALNITITHDDQDMYLVDLTDQDGWPVDENAGKIVAPDFASDFPIQAGFGYMDGKNVYCIKISGLSSEQFDQYIGQLELAGFEELTGGKIVTPEEFPSVVVGTPSENSDTVIVLKSLPPFAEKSWNGIKKVDNDIIECQLYFGPTLSGSDVEAFDATPFLYINILLPAE